MERVIEIATKYGFKAMMWSDMFFRLAGNGDYYDLNVNITDEIKENTPKNISLVYWDYYHEDKNIYSAMLKNHKKFNNQIWFAGGAWSWKGFAPSNKFTLETMVPAMEACRENNIDNIFLTMWGDNGKECSFFSLLPSLYHVKKVYEGETDIKKIKKGFEELTGENYDKLCMLDLPDLVGDNEIGNKNPSKYMLYSDVFSGYLDSVVIDGVDKEYLSLSKKLLAAGKESKFEYLFKSMSDLCKVLSIKYSLGVRTRKIYKSGNKAKLSEIIEDYKKIEGYTEEFYYSFRKLWFKENKPNGFDVQDQRLGGLIRRLKACRERLQEYLNEEIDSIDELENEILDYTGKGKETLNFNVWEYTVTSNIL